MSYCVEAQVANDTSGLKRTQVNSQQGYQVHTLGSFVVYIIAAVNSIMMLPHTGQFVSWLNHTLGDVSTLIFDCKMVVAIFCSICTVCQWSCPLKRLPLYSKIWLNFWTDEVQYPRAFMLIQIQLSHKRTMRFNWECEHKLLILILLCLSINCNAF